MGIGIHEQLIPLADVPRLLPRPNGKQPSLCAVYRWTSHGVRGGIVLETIQGPSGRLTSLEAIGRFLHRLTAAAGINATGVHPAAVTDEATDAELTAQGFCAGNEA